MADCCAPRKGKIGKSDIALAGNPNTGKSTLFNALTGLGAVVSNYPGTTVDILVGTTIFKDSKLVIADLPGTYALSEDSAEEAVAKQYLEGGEARMIVNVLDANHLERNLYLTLQLLELRVPMVVALNFFQESEDRGVHIDAEKLAHILGVPVVPIDPVNGHNVELLIEQSVKTLNKPLRKAPEKKGASAQALNMNAQRITRAVSTGDYKPRSANERLNRLTTEPFTGYLIMGLVLAALFAALFFFGEYLGDLTNIAFTALIGAPLKHLIAYIPNSVARTVLSFGLVDGINAALQVALPYISIFYIMMAILEDSGYLPRMAYLLDKTMHRIGLHGKSIIPMMLGFGCTVPAILSTRMLPNRRDRVLTAILVNFVPCSARTAVILGAAGRFIGWQYALIIYAISLVLLLIAGFVLARILPGESLGLVLEMPEYRWPRTKNVLSKTWMRLKDFVYIAFPMVVVGSAVLGLLIGLDLLAPLTRPFGPLISGWLMLPAVAGITLIYGVLRKELALEMLVLLGGSANLLAFMSPVQIFTFCVVVTLYFPCITAFTVLKHEFGWRDSLVIAFSTVILAVVVAGIAGRVVLMTGLLPG